jgi:hypothetical protein
MRYIIINRSVKIICWGRYNLYRFEQQFFLTKKSYMCEGATKELIVMEIPKYLMCDVINKKHIDARYIRKMREWIIFYEKNKLQGKDREIKGESELQSIA